MSYKTHSNSWPVNVIIMSGGKGTRLKLLTENKHKSLIEVGEKSVIVHLIEHLTLFGLHNVYISVGHLSEQIINSIEDGSKLDASIKYIHESIPMGSISSLSLEQNWEHEHFLILNGDIFTNFNLNHFISTYFSKKVDMAILTSQNIIPFQVQRVVYLAYELRPTNPGRFAHVANNRKKTDKSPIP